MRYWIYAPIITHEYMLGGLFYSALSSVLAAFTSLRGTNLADLSEKICYLSPKNLSRQEKVARMLVAVHGTINITQYPFRIAVRFAEPGVTVWMYKSAGTWIVSVELPETFSLGPVLELFFHAWYEAEIQSRSHITFYLRSADGELTLEESGDFLAEWAVDYMLEVRNEQGISRDERLRKIARAEEYLKHFDKPRAGSARR